MAPIPSSLPSRREVHNSSSLSFSRADQIRNADEKKSFLDATTVNVLWEAEKRLPASWDPESIGSSLEEYGGNAPFSAGSIGTM